MVTSSTARSGRRFQDAKSPLDELGRRILAALAADPRRSVADLAREVGASAPTVRERVARLEEAGVIRGYRLDVDPAAIGLPVAAWVRIRPGPGQLPKVAELAARTPEVSECHRISGEDCFLLKVHVAVLEDLEDVLDRFLIHGQTTSSLIVSTPVPARPVLPGQPRSRDSSSSQVSRRTTTREAPSRTKTTGMRRAPL